MTNNKWIRSICMWTWIRDLRGMIIRQFKNFVNEMNDSSWERRYLTKNRKRFYLILHLNNQFWNFHNRINNIISNLFVFSRILWSVTWATEVLRMLSTTTLWSSTRATEDLCFFSTVTIWYSTWATEFLSVFSTVTSWLIWQNQYIIG